MGKIRQGILGGIIGKIGLVCGQSHKSDALILKNKGKLKKGNKVVNGVQATKFRQLNQFFILFGELFRNALVIMDVTIIDLRMNVFKTTLGLPFTFNNVYSNNCFWNYPRLYHYITAVTSFFPGNENYLVSFQNLNKQRLQTGPTYLKFVRFSSSSNKLEKRTLLYNSDNADIGIVTTSGKPHDLEYLVAFIVSDSGVILSDIYFSGYVRN